MRPKRSTVLLLLLAAVVSDAFLLLSMPPQGTLDARLFYTPQGGLDFLQSCDASARAVYRLFSTFDFAFIVVYGILLVTWLRFLRNRAAVPRRLHPVLGLVPALFDVVETASIFTMLGDLDAVPAALPIVAAVATPLKWLTGAGVGVVIVWGEVRWVRSRRARKKAAATVRRS